jgi:hypothetical protein
MLYTINGQEYLMLFKIAGSNYENKEAQALHYTLLPGIFFCYLIFSGK